MFDKRQPIKLLLVLSIFVSSSILFLDGFFEITYNRNGKTGEQYFNNQIADKLDQYTLQPPSVKYSQIVLMIIDAWRTDYPNATNMPFAYEHACDHLQIKVDIPTVTMPRIKSLTTGTISNFIDIVLNLGHTTELNESILHSLQQKKKNAVFAGDRTWIELFPNKFLRAAVNMDSFFVNDFYEGDLNVTKTLTEELNYHDWHLLILHYLGLDHIGHVEGSHSDKIFAKLLEMDNVINYTEANMDPESLLLLTGDHGMRNGGSHGGSDVEELHVPLMAFSKNCVRKKRSYNNYNQIDISATLAVLLDVKIPRTSTGCLIPEMLEIFSKKEQLYLYHYNALHLMDKLKSKINMAETDSDDYSIWYNDAKASHKEFISSASPSFLSYETAKQNYIRLSKKISQLLTESSIQTNTPQILVALSLTTLCAIKLLMMVFFENIPSLWESKYLLWKHFCICFAFASCINFFSYFFNLHSQSIVRWLMITFFTTLNIYFAIDILKSIFFLIISPLIHNRKVMFKLGISSVLFLLFLCHIMSLGSSSFIEEEHQTWYYFTPSLLILVALQNFYNDVKRAWQKVKPYKALLHAFWNIRFIYIVMLSIIGCRRLNQTGDKWRNIIDIGDVLSKSENHNYLALTLLTGLLLLLLLLNKYNSGLEMFFCFVAVSCVFLYRQVKHNSFLILGLFWTSLFCTQLKYCRIICYKRKKFGYYTKENIVGLLERNLTCCFLISALLHKPHNVILLPIMLYTLEKSYHMCDKVHKNDKRVYNALVLKTVITICIANMFYFFQGNSNSLATIDLNPGFIGLSSYNPPVVGLLITLNTYCAHINTFLYLIWHMFSTQKNVLPLRQENERILNEDLMESTEEDLYLVYSLFTAATIMPVAAYWCLLVCFRYHLFIYSVFAPKSFYEFFHLLVFYINFILTNLYFSLFLK